MRSNDPQNIDDDNWYYEEGKGLCLVHRVYIEGQYQKTDQVTIPWRMLKKSVERKEAELENRRKRYKKRKG